MLEVTKGATESTICYPLRNKDNFILRAVKLGSVLNGAEGRNQLSTSKGFVQSGDNVISTTFLRTRQSHGYTFFLIGLT